MAGPFGFEGGEHYDVSVEAGERVLLPAVREAATPDTRRGRRLQLPRSRSSSGLAAAALHLAQLLHMALEGVKPSDSQAPETTYETMLAGESEYRLQAPLSQRMLVGLLGASVIAGAGAIWRGRHA